MKIKYANGTERITDDVIRCLDIDLEPGYVIFGGLVWESEEKSENDDGSKAIAKLYHDDGTEAVEFE